LSTPVLHVLAGSNGAGKSTLAERILIPRTHLPFVNADLIAEQLWPGDRDGQSQGAAEVSRKAEAHRGRLLERRVSFIAETVFSHESKLDLLRDAQRLGYSVTLHVVMVPEELAVARVADRVRAGGHLVPEEKIRGRYARLWALIAQARGIADQAEFYDNSSLDRPLRRIARYEYGRQVGQPDWPDWTPAVLLSDG
jgi:predicted ABC-type ATPase